MHKGLYVGDINNQHENRNRHYTTGLFEFQPLPFPEEESRSNRPDRLDRTFNPSVFDK